MRISERDVARCRNTWNKLTAAEQRPRWPTRWRATVTIGRSASLATSQGPGIFWTAKSGSGARQSGSVLLKISSRTDQMKPTFEEILAAVKGMVELRIFRPMTHRVK